MTNSRRIHGPASRAVGDEQGTHGWYRRAKGTKRGEKGGRESEHLVVSSKRGNRPSWTPWREGDAALWTSSRNHAEGIEPPSVSPQSGWVVRGTANPQRDEPYARKCTYGSVGALGEQSPRATRPVWRPNSRLIPSLRPRLRGRRMGRQRWYRQAKETKCGETVGGESEHAVVLCEAGEQRLLDPVEERACRVVGL